MVVICKYYQQGRCRFGNQCKFQHSDVYDDSGTSRGGRLNDQYHYYKPDRPDVNEILQAVQQEVITSEKGKQWPLSCFAPLKEFSNVTGWDDISPEELRWQMYLSRQTGDLDDCVRQIQELDVKAKINKATMLNPTSETYSIIESIFSKSEASNFSFAQNESQTHSTFTPGIFGSSIFGGSSASTSSGNGAFGSPQQSQPIGQTTSIFGGSSAGFGIPANAASSAFNTVATGHSSSIFGGSATSATQPTSFFGSPQPGSSSVFGNTSPSLSGNVFGNVPTASTTNIFGNTISATPSPSNVFGMAAHSTSIFGSQPSQPAGSNFGGFNPAVGQTFENTPQVQSQLFQNSTPTTFGNTNAFGINQITDVSGDGTYTPIRELPENILALFKADKYVLGLIPTVPPPKELCF